MLAVSLANGTQNHSLGTAGFVSSPSGSPADYNPGLAPKALAFAKPRLRAARESEAYSDWALAMGGKPPYTYSIVSPAAGWLSINAQTGELSGTPPESSAGAVAVDITVGDTNLASVTHTEALVITGAIQLPGATMALGNGIFSGGPGQVFEVPVTLSGASLPGPVTGFGFELRLPAATAQVLEILHVRPDTATLVSGMGVWSMAVASDRVLVSSQGTPALPLLPGSVAVVGLRTKVSTATISANTAFDIVLSDVRLNTQTGAFAGEGSTGTATANAYPPYDVNRDGFIDVVDVQLTVNLILQLMSPPYPGCGDANGDSQIDVVDVQVIVNCILLGGC
jgi:hypothetical protein